MPASPTLTHPTPRAELHLADRGQDQGDQQARPLRLHPVRALIHPLTSPHTPCTLLHVRTRYAPSPPSHAPPYAPLRHLSRYTPADPGKSGLSLPCPTCGFGCKEWDAHCGECGTHFPACIVSGKAILEPHLAAQCRACKHRYYESEAHERGLRNCALCHTPLPLLGSDSPGDLELHGYRQ